MKKKSVPRRSQSKRKREPRVRTTTITEIFDPRDYRRKAITHKKTVEHNLNGSKVRKKIINHTKLPLEKLAKYFPDDDCNLIE